MNKVRIFVPQITDVGQGKLFLTSGYGTGCMMIEVKKTGKTFGVKEIFANKNSNAQMATPLLHDNHLYINSNDNSTFNGLVCMDLSGKVVWQTEKSPNFEKGQMILADGMIYIINGKEGSLHLIEPSTKGFKELAKVEGVLGKAVAKPAAAPPKKKPNARPGRRRRPPREKGKECWAPLALSNGLLVIRDHGSIKCLDVRKK